jgi:prepilin-type N-terminal cleavage/methylation domain-containing protein
MSSLCKLRGFTLMELIVSLAVISIAGVALISTLAFIASSSGRTSAEAQARAIADAYLAEILSRPVVDPAPPSGETARGTFDDIGDYNGLYDSTARDPSGVSMGGQFSVQVNVSSSAALAGIPAAQTRRVDVTVQGTNGIRVLASGYRTNRPLP